MGTGRSETEETGFVVIPVTPRAYHYATLASVRDAAIVSQLTRESIPIESGRRCANTSSGRTIDQDKYVLASM